MRHFFYICLYFSRLSSSKPSFQLTQQTVTMSGQSLTSTTPVFSFESIAGEILSWIMLFVIDSGKSEFYLKLVCKSWHQHLLSTLYWEALLGEFFLILQIQESNNDSSSYTQFLTNSSSDGNVLSYWDVIDKWRLPDSCLLPKIVHVNGNQMEILSSQTKQGIEESLFTRYISKVSFVCLIITDPEMVNLSDYACLNNVESILIDLSSPLGHLDDNISGRSVITYNRMILLLKDFLDGRELNIWNTNLTLIDINEDGINDGDQVLKRLSIKNGEVVDMYTNVISKHNLRDELSSKIKILDFCYESPSLRASSSQDLLSISWENSIQPV